MSVLDDVDIGFPYHALCLSFRVFPVTADVLLGLCSGNQSMSSGEEKVESVAEESVRVERGGACLAHCSQHAGVPVRC